MDRKDLKPTLLLALMLFLISAPAPDSATIMEMTGNTLVPSGQTGLQAANPEQDEKEPDSADS